MNNTTILDANAVPSMLDIFGNLRCRPDIPNSVYHADRSCVSVSGLKQLLRSPAHYQAYLSGEGRKETAAMYMGTAIHSRLLEPAAFSVNYVVAPEDDKRSKEYKEFVAANDGKLILTKSQADAIEGVAASVDLHVSASTLLRAGHVEHSIIWQDEETGIWLKIRPDCLCTDFDSGICLDVKKTVDASSAAFVRACVTYDYDLQAAVYLEGLRQVFQRDFDFVFLAVEETPPYGCALYGAPEEMLARGRRRFRQAMAILQACQGAGEWPSYQPAGDYELMEWPRWAA